MIYYVLLSSSPRAGFTSIEGIWKEHQFDLAKAAAEEFVLNNSCLGQEPADPIPRSSGSAKECVWHNLANGAYVEIHKVDVDD